MRVLITGATGFIGKEALSAMTRRGLDVHSLGRTAPDRDGVPHHMCDLLNDDVTPLLATLSASHLLHLAWYAEPGQFWGAKENLDWVAASLRLTRAFAETGGQRMVATGSCAEYAWGDPVLRERATPLTPATLYGASKVALSGLLEAAAPTLGLSIGWARIFFPYGPYERSERLLGTLIRAAATGETALFSSGLQRRDFMHVDDMAEALAQLLLSDVEGPVNIGSGAAVPVRDFVTIAAEASEVPPQIQFGTRPLQANEPEEFAADIRRLRDEVGFSPRFTLAEGLADAVRRGVDRYR